MGLAVMVLISTLEVAQACTLSMGYRTNARPPLIEKHPNSDGLYSQLYQKAAERIGCQLKVVRKAKKVVLKMLREGQVDFYPGFNFTEKRSAFTFYMVNGLPGGDVGVSRDDLAEVTQLQQLKGRTVLSALGSPRFVKGVPGVREQRLPELTTLKALKLLGKKRGDFFIYNRSTILYTIKQNSLKGLKVHADCCGGNKPLYLGFSRQSPHFKGVPNENYQAEQPLSVTNFPIQLVTTSVAYRFQQALAQLAEEGWTQILYGRHYQ
uniref:Putative ABC-type amino acid transport/signal transduction systems, periplasmic component/domain n=1 Tax=Magnetococcus massalia (strain MO-1) TaxID=451514 RepID=A0A1S7LIP7_MAGMO|nr:Putative ABC-type amino acid transport/signal transduction systems, periplasmic component/domain [Candidatus Magnetococcus massalia]